MASIGHVAVGMAAARLSSAEHALTPTWRSMALWSALSLMPDADVIGFSFGVEYGEPWGHRGATHSITFALVLGGLVALAARRFRARPLRVWATASAVLVSHGLLDTMTDGGLGCALFWPFDLTRYFAPWRPIPVAPIGLAFFSPHGLLVSLAELVLFFPIAAYALKLTRQPDAAECHTRGIHVGMTRDAVLRALGPPDGTCAIYSRSPSQSYFRARGVCFEGGHVVEVHRLWTME